MTEYTALLQAYERGDLEAAAKSGLRFILGTKQLAIYNGGGTGWRLAPWEAAEYFGDRFEEIAEYGAAKLPLDKAAAGRNIRKSREALNLTRAELAGYLKMPEQLLEDAEEKGVDIGSLRQLAQNVNLDEALISVDLQESRTRLSGRLRAINHDEKISKPDVWAFAEAAWVALTQKKLERWLGEAHPIGIMNFEKCDEFGHSPSGAAKIGYELAAYVRRKLDLGIEPVSMRETCETLGIPVIQTSLSSNLAGATISVDGIRAIVLANDASHDVYARRMTVAHELCHLLNDADERLKDIRVDTVEMIGGQGAVQTDLVESRANAFAAHFLAPLDRGTFIPRSGSPENQIREIVDIFGISIATAKYHAANKLGISVDHFLCRTEDMDVGSWEGKESLGLYNFPIRNAPLSRRGKFAWYVVQCYRKNLISDMTAAGYLGCDVGEFVEKAPLIEEMYA